MSPTETPEAALPASETAVMHDEPLVGALQSLYRAYQKTSIYPSGHPAIPEALARSTHEFEEALESRASIHVGVARDRLLLDDEPLDESTGALQSLAMLLHDLDIAAVEFHRDLDAVELQHFIEVLGYCRRERHKGGTVVEQLEQRATDHLVAIPLDYGKLQFTEGLRGHASGPDGPQVWERLCTGLSDPVETHPDLGAELARQVNEQIENNEGTGIGGLRRRIHSMSGRIESLSPEEQEALRARLREFIAELNPELRGDLLRVDTGENNIPLLTDLAELIPEPDLLDALQEVDRTGRRVPEQLLTLMNKLVRISGERSSLASGLQDVMTRWGIEPPPGVEEATNMRAALEELFQRRSDEDPNPDAYQALLDDLATSDVQATDHVMDGKYRDPRDAEDVRLHAAEIAVLALGKSGGDEHRAGLFGYIEASADRLLAHRRFEALRDAAVSARTYSLLSKQGQTTRRAANGFLEEFGKERRILEILSRACSGSHLPDAAVDLLGLGGSSAVGLALDFVDRKRPHDISQKLIRFVADAGPERIAAMVEERSAAGWPRLKPIFEILRELDSGAATPILTDLAAHAEDRVRREAVLLLCEVDRRPGALERHLTRALGDADQRLVAIAIFRLSHHGTPRAIETLGRFVAGRLTGVEPTPGMAARAARALPSGGQRGYVALREALDSLHWSMQPTRISRALMIAELLELHDDDATRDSLQRWRRSPAGRLSRVLPSIRRSAVRGDE